MLVIYLFQCIHLSHFIINNNNNNKYIFVKRKKHKQYLDALNTTEKDYTKYQKVIQEKHY